MSRHIHIHIHDAVPKGTYEVIESKIWMNKKTGATASIYGAVPWTSSSDKGNWEVRTSGWTVYNNRTGTTGIGRQPWSSKGDAEAWVRQQEGG